MPLPTSRWGNIPDYDSLDTFPGRPAGSSWGLWGAEDKLGTLNLLDSSGITVAAGQVRYGDAFGLNLDLNTPNSLMLGRRPYRHRYQNIGDYGADDVLDDFNTQLSTQWDGFGHVRHPVHGHYNGLRRQDHGIDHWARRGIAGRGVLADVARWRQHHGDPLRMDQPDRIGADDLRATLAWQDTEVSAGDILLIRTGWVGWYQRLSTTERAAMNHGDCVSPGLTQDEDTCRFLWNLHVAAAAADNTSFEAAPFRQIDGVAMAVLADPAQIARYTLMYNLLALLGLPFGELFDLDALADHCYRNRRWTFLFTSAPLALGGAVGSPANAIAIV